MVFIAAILIIVFSTLDVLALGGNADFRRAVSDTLVIRLLIAIIARAVWIIVLFAITVLFFEKLTPFISSKKKK